MKFSRRNWLRSASTMTASGLFVNAGISKFYENSHTPKTGEIILNSNENAWGPSPNVLKAIQQSSLQSNRYPWQTRQILIDRISQLEGIPADHILLGAGSTEILQLAGLAFGAHGGTIVSSYPTFPLMMQHATGFNAKWIKVDLDRNFNHDFEALKKAAQNAQLIYISNPNNPLGTLSDKSTLLDFCRSLPSTTIAFIDEAYMEFTDQGLKSSLAKEILSYPNLIVARTFSKIYGMAGLRVGYAYAHPDLIEKMKHYHIGFEINMPITSLHAAIAATEDQQFLQDCKQANSSVRNKVGRSFTDWKVEYVPSQTNFIYFRTERFDPALVELLAKHQVLIRDYADQPGYARVSMGTEEQIDIFLSKAKSFLA
ncbi:MAG: histidinol-phosphate aminotransferase family protein [Saprospiraceae bacterium]|nr:histidinol-phosphate aminotransferase family protein [Saprospiraceae bacterium]